MVYKKAVGAAKKAWSYRRKKQSYYKTREASTRFDPRTQTHFVQPALYGSTESSSSSVGDIAKWGLIAGLGYLVLKNKLGGVADDLNPFGSFTDWLKGGRYPGGDTYNVPNTSVKERVVNRVEASPTYRRTESVFGSRKGESVLNVTGRPSQTEVVRILQPGVTPGFMGLTPHSVGAAVQDVFKPDIRERVVPGLFGISPFRFSNVLSNFRRRVSGSGRVSTSTDSSSVVSRLTGGEGSAYQRKIESASRSEQSGSTAGEAKLAKIQAKTKFTISSKIADAIRKSE